jgi:hypothetical protein
MWLENMIEIGEKLVVVHQERVWRELCMIGKEVSKKKIDNGSLAGANDASEVVTQAQGNKSCTDQS